MELPDNAVIAFAVTVGPALGAAIKVLWDRSEKCLADREKQAERIDKLEERVFGCPIADCPNRPTWKPITVVTTNGPRLPNLPPQTS